MDPELRDSAFELKRTLDHVLQGATVIKAGTNPYNQDGFDPYETDTIIQLPGRLLELFIAAARDVLSDIDRLTKEEDASNEDIQP